MRKNRQLFIALAVCLCLFMALAFGYSLWSAKKAEGNRAEYVRSQYEFFRKLSIRLDEFSDALQLADALPRENLPASIAKLQSLRRIVSTTPLPDCFDSWDKLDALETRVLMMTYFLRFDDRQEFGRDRANSNRVLADLKNTLERECSTIRIVQLSFEQDFQGK